MQQLQQMRTSIKTPVILNYTMLEKLTATSTTKNNNNNQMNDSLNHVH